MKTVSRAGMRIVFVALCLLGCKCKEDNRSSGDTGGDTADTDKEGPPELGQTETRLYVTEFDMQSSVLVGADGPEISSSSFVEDEWYPVTVPTTVLSGLVENGVYPDPYLGLNNMLIPDAHDGFNEQYNLAQYSHLPNQENPWADPYYFRAVIKLPKDFSGKQVRLTFNGINYRADIWLNGQAIATSKEVVGMFEQFTFDVTESALPGKENVLVTAIHPLDYPAEPSPPQLEPLGSFGNNCGQDSEIGKNVTMQSSIGWDWIPEVRDRNMGIWQDVFFSAVDPLDLRHPNVKTEIDFGETTTAALTVTADIANPTDKPVAGVLYAKISPFNFNGDVSIKVSQSVTIDPSSETEIAFSPEDYGELVIDDPALWQPNPYGDPNLYTLSLVLTVDGNTSDAEEIHFGIREIGTDVVYEGQNPGRSFLINGKKIQLRGGAWVPDMLVHRDKARYEKELQFSKEANFNTVRIWGGGVTPPDTFFDICDELGLLVWLDFWITGDCQGTWGRGTQDWPLDGDAFLSNARSVVQRVRSHPSLILYTAGNEAYPREELYKALRNDIINDMDGTRPFLPSSGMEASPPEDWGLSLPDNEPAGVYTGGPYWWVSPDQYFQYARSTPDWLFKDEIGVASVPPVRSLEKFILDTEPDPDAPFPLNSTFAYHDAADSAWMGMFSTYDTAIRSRYGEVTSLADYAAKAQIVTAENLRAIFEAANASLDRVGGVLLWKTNAAWPSVIWQVYDWYLSPNAGYYFTKKAGELLHVQLNLSTMAVELVNRGLEDKEGLTVRMEALDQNLAIVTEQSKELDVAENSVESVFTLQIPEEQTGVVLVKLVLSDADDKTLSENFYWLSANNDFTYLTSLEKIDLTVDGAASEDDDTVTVAADVTNPSDTLAFFVNLLVLKGEDGEEVLPTYWDDNYFSLLPGETRHITATFSAADIGDAEPHLRVEGINITPKTIAL